MPAERQSRQVSMTLTSVISPGPSLDHRSSGVGMGENTEGDDVGIVRQGKDHPRAGNGHLICQALPAGVKRPVVGVGAELRVETVSSNFFRAFGNPDPHMSPGGRTVDVLRRGLAHHLDRAVRNRSIPDAAA